MNSEISGVLGEPYPPQEKQMHNALVFTNEAEMQLLKGKWKNTSQWGSTNLTNALTYQVGKNHRVEKHTINGTECTFKDSRISTSTNRETPIIWLSSIKILPLYMHEGLQVLTSKYVIIPSDRCHHRKIRHECTTAQWHCQVVYTPYWVKHSHLWPQTDWAFCWTSGVNEKT